MSHRLPIDTVVYFNDIETDAAWRRTRDLLVTADIDGVDFYYIREHELRHFSPEVVRHRIARLAERAEELRARGIHTGLALVPSLGWGQAVEEGPFEKITGPDGVRSGMGSCPLDPDLGDYLRQIASAAAAAGFASISLEDDFQNDNHRPVKHGCFCDRHMQAFSKVEGKTWTRAKLAEALPDDGELTARWNTFRRGVLAELAGSLFDAARSQSPTVQFVLLAGADVMFDPGQVTDAINCRTWRPGQGGYTESRFAPLEGPWIGSATHQAHGVPRGMQSLAEITSWPRNSYTKSWSTVMLQAGASVFLGLDRLLLWLGHGLRDPHFADVIGGSRNWLDAVQSAFDDCPRQRGLLAPMKPTGFTVDTGLISLARLGIPAIPIGNMENLDAGDPLWLASRGCIAADPATIAGRPVVLDAQTAAAHADLLGLSVEPAPAFYSCERYSDHPCNGTYQGMYSSSLTLLKAAEIQRIGGVESAVALGEYLSNDSKPLAASVLLDTDRRRLVFNHSPRAWEMVMGQCKAEQARRAMEALLGRPLCAAVAGGTDVAPLVRDGEGSRAVLLLNLSNDAATGWSMPMDFTPAASWRVRPNGRPEILDATRCPTRGRPDPLPPRSATLFHFQRAG